MVRCSVFAAGGWEERSSALGRVEVGCAHNRWVYATQATYADRQPIRVVCYFNGLGRPLDLTLDDFKSDRCWFGARGPFRR